MYKTKNKIIIITFISISASLYSCGNKDNKTESQGNQQQQTTKTETENKEIQNTDDFIINYDLVGTLNGKMSIYRSGKKLKQKIESEVMGIKNANEIFIIDNFVFNVTEIAGKKMGIKTNIQDYNKKKQTGETITDFREFEKFLSEKKVTGPENILGYNCDIYDLGNGISISVYNKKYLLKIKSPEFLATATSINFSPTFAANEFEVPSGVNFKDINMEGIDKKMLDSLLKNQKGE